MPQSSGKPVRFGFAKASAADAGNGNAEAPDTDTGSGGAAIPRPPFGAHNYGGDSNKGLKSTAPAKGTNPETLSFAVRGMSCASCVGRVEKAAGAVQGIEAASVNLATERASLTFSEPKNAATVARNAFEAVRGAGYTVAEETLQAAIGGMHCAGCVGKVEKALKAIPGVIAASANLATEQASLRSAEGSVTLADIEAALAAHGFTASPVEEETATNGNATTDGESRRDARKREETAALRRNLILAAVLTLPVFILEMGGHLFPAFHHWIGDTIGQRNSWYLQFILTTVVLAIPGRQFYRLGGAALLRFAPDMNSLVALGTIAAWGYSLVATFLPQALPQGATHVYYEAAAVIVTLILLGRYLEARAKGRTGEAIRRLAGLQAKTARVVQQNGSAAEIPLAQVKTGDLILVRPGERIATDGEVTEGESYVDESMLSGEPLPVAKSAGAEVTGGTINKSGSFTFRATKVGKDTVLAQIIRMVEQAQAAKLPIQALADKVTLRFVPAVIAVAAFTFVLWLVLGPSLTHALVSAVAVLIIACPCAMGLATPTSVMVGTGRAAQMGVLFRKGDALQTLREAAVVALDKTGTLTEGKPALTDLVATNGFTRETVLRLTATAEARSEHPIAEAITAAALAEGITLPAAQNFEAIAGFGIRATVEGQNVLAGADRLLHRENIATNAFAAEAERLGKEGKTPLYVAIDGTLAAILAVADPIRATSAAAIAALHALGLKVAMITGDNHRTAEAVAAQLGIDEAVAEVLPEGKVDAIKRLAANGARKVAFVGDGINDAPALAQADVGIAIGSGTDVAIESADVILVRGDLRGVVDAIAISKATIRNIRQNLFWAFAYNVVLIPVAAGALYPAFGILLSPMLAAAAMALSSVFVLGNALRLRGFKPAKI